MIVTLLLGRLFLELGFFLQDETVSQAHTPTPKNKTTTKNKEKKKTVRRYTSVADHLLNIVKAPGFHPQCSYPEDSHLQKPSSSFQLSQIS